MVGLGEIGRGVAGGLHRAGLVLSVCDVRPEATAPWAGRATVASDPAAAARDAEVVVVAVVDDAQVRAVTGGRGGVLAGARPGTCVLVLSTVAPDTVLEVAAAAAGSGVDVLDCAVTGGPAAASAARFVAMVGGDEAVLARARPVLDAFCSLVVHMGPLGAGLKAKLARNLISYGSWLAAYEAQRLAEAAGVDLARLAEVVKASDPMTGGSSALMFRRSVAPFTDADDAGLVAAMRAAAALAHKDLQAALDLGAGLGVPMPLAELTARRADAVFGVGPDPADPGGGL